MFYASYSRDAFSSKGVLQLSRAFSAISCLYMQLFEQRHFFQDPVLHVLQ